jgi:hypothetical protein
METCFIGLGQAVQGSIHKINTLIRQHQISTASLNSIKKIINHICTPEAGILEHSVVGPQIALGKWVYAYVFLCDVICKYRLHIHLVSHTTKFEALKVTSLKMQVFWDVTHHLVNSYTHSEG